MKKFLWIFSVVVLVLVGYFIYDNRVGFGNLFDRKFGTSVNDKSADELRAREMRQQYLDSEKKHMRFAGQNRNYTGMQLNTSKYAILIKGKLLDAAYQKIYDKIPDTIYLEFGKGLYFVERSHNSPFEPHARFVLNGNYGLDSLTMNANAEEYELQEMFSKLVYDGKAEGYRIYPENFSSSKYLYPFEIFEKKYKDYFEGNSDYEELDYDIKDALLTFLDSEEGENFGYPKDQRSYKELIHLDNYTGSGKPELALVLRDKKVAETGKPKEVLLVVAYNNSNKSYYILHKEYFHCKIIVKPVTYYPESRFYESAHMEEERPSAFYSLLLKAPCETDRILQYDRAFDKMIKINLPERHDE